MNDNDPVVKPSGKAFNDAHFWFEPSKIFVGIWTNFVNLILKWSNSMGSPGKRFSDTTLKKKKI